MTMETIEAQRLEAVGLNAVWEAYLPDHKLGANAFMILLDEYGTDVLESSIKRTAKKQMMSSGAMTTKQLLTYLQSSATTSTVRKGAYDRNAEQ